MTPSSLDIDAITVDLEKRFPDIKNLYHAHLWTITPDMLVFSAHIKLCDSCLTITQQSELITRMEEHLREKYKVIETTFQIDDTDGDEESCRFVQPENGG